MYQVNLTVKRMPKLKTSNMSHMHLTNDFLLIYISRNKITALLPSVSVYNKNQNSEVLGLFTSLLNRRYL